MRFEHTVVVPLGLPETRRLLDELERRIPALPGVVVRVELTVVDPRSTSVRLRGDASAGSGLRSAVLSEAAMAVLRRFAEQVVAAARARAKLPARRAASATATARPLRAAPVVPLLRRPHACWAGAALGDRALLAEPSPARR